SAALYADAVVLGSPRRMAAAGALLGLALIVRAQVLEYMVAVIAVALAATAPRWSRSRDARRLVLALALGMAPALCLWVGIRWSVGTRDDVVRMAQAGWLAAEQPALAGVFLVPLALAVLHGLVFPWPRYNVPAMPILLAAAGALLARLAISRPWREPRTRRTLLTVAAPAAATLLL